MLSHLPSGSVVQFEYKAAEGHWEPRVGVIWSKRNLEEKPLSSEAIAKRPDLERGKILLKIWDIARGEYRSFYVERVRNWRTTDLHPILMVAAERLRKTG